MSQQTGQKPPPYSEEQVTRWLAFLARGMTEHGQTITLIEYLQPSWLSSNWYRWIYLLVSRLIFGVVSGLLVGAIVALLGSVTIGLSRIFSNDSGNSPDALLFGALLLGLIFGLAGCVIGGIIGGLMDVINLARNNVRYRQGKSRNHRFVLTVLFMMASIGIVLLLIFGEVEGLIFGLNGLVFGPIWISRNSGLSNEIKTIEAIHFYWADFPNGFRNVLGIGINFGVVIGLIVGVIVWLNIGLIGGLSDIISDFVIFALVFGTSGALLIGLFFGLIGGLIPSIQTSVLELKMVPNQGIWLSMRSAGMMGGGGGLALGTIVGLFGGWTSGLAYGLLGGLCIALWYGGLDVIQHFLVRFLLWRAGSLPWRLAPFLDYAAEELHFLQKVGGGYIFVHRYLLEHFAAMETDDGRPRTADSA